MPSIFGIISRDNIPIPLEATKSFQAEIPAKGDELCNLWSGDRASFEWTRELLPNEQTRTNDGVVFVAAGRIDNRIELGRLLQIYDAELSELSDGDLLKLCYMKWGEGSSARVYGDWAYVAWHIAERRLVLSRDHHGNTSLYYYIDEHVFAFSTNRKALLALDIVPAEIDELYVAQYLTSWMAYHGERTPHKYIHRLPPAHSLCVTQDKCRIWQYWKLEDTPELHLADRRDYVEAFLPIFDEAVRCRLRSDGPMACTLSGGLDSSSVAATAAQLLRVHGQRLTAFTSVPFFDTTGYIKTRFPDELPYAQATARHTGNIDLHSMPSDAISPVNAIRRALQITPDLCYGAGNLYWLLDIQQTARSMGSNVLLTGAIGNGGVSWNGDIYSQSWAYILEKLGWRGLARGLFRRGKEKTYLELPMGITAAIRERRMDRAKWLRASAINPVFARRLRLIEQMVRDPRTLPARNPRETRMRYFLPGRSMSGAYIAELNAIHGIQERDPTADARLLAFTFSVPDRIFIDTKTGIDRWLIREAMKGRLPDEVRLNRNRGVQAGDLVPRLLGCADEVDEALDEIARGPAAEFVDVTYMREVWQMNRTQISPESRVKSITVLTRGIMAGLLVNQFYE